MKTLDLKKELKYLYAPSEKRVEILHVPRLQFAMIDGTIGKRTRAGQFPILSGSDAGIIWDFLHAQIHAQETQDGCD